MMLKLLNLYVIEKIFEKAETKVSPLAKMMYLNCLIHYFKDKEATYENAYAFNLHDSDFDFQAYKKTFHELDKVGLITLNGSVITFNNVWGQLIDRTQLKADTLKPKLTATHFRDRLLNNQKLSELCQMKYRLTQSKVNELIELFVKEQDAINKEYSSESDCIRHCNFWIGTHKEKIVIVKKTPNSFREEVKK